MEDKSVENVKNNFDLINHYDINSLYPSQTNSNKYPTDMICEFIGDITTNSEFKNLYDDFVGIYKDHMYGPDIEHPIMLVKINGYTIFGKGEWIGCYYSEELKKKTLKNRVINSKFLVVMYSNQKTYLMIKLMIYI